MSEQNKKALIDFAMKELQKVVEDIKRGKPPTISKELKKLQEIILKANDKNMKPEDSDILADNLIKDIEKSKDK